MGALGGVNDVLGVAARALEVGEGAASGGETGGQAGELSFCQIGLMKYERIAILTAQPGTLSSWAEAVAAKATAARA